MRHRASSPAECYVRKPSRRAPDLLRALSSALPGKIHQSHRDAGVNLFGGLRWKQGHFGAKRGSKWPINGAQQCGENPGYGGSPKTGRFGLPPVVGRQNTDSSLQNTDPSHSQSAITITRVIAVLGPGALYVDCTPQQLQSQPV